MPKKILFVVLLCGVANFASAKVFINEIMYDAEGSDVDWIEIKNEGDDVDISALKLLVSNSTSNHGIKSYSGSATLKDGEYGIIVASSQASAFEERWSAKNLFTASFSLPNAGGATVEINAGDKNDPMDSVTYETGEAKGDGNSLQLVDGSLAAGLPTPGEANTNEQTGEEEEEESQEKKQKEPVVRAKIVAEDTVFAGEPASFRGMITEDSRDAKYYGEYYWNFGDGSSLYDVGQPDRFPHLFYYPGEYRVVMEYRHKYYIKEDPDYESAVTVKAVPREITMKRTSGGTEIHNGSKYPIDISAWSIINGEKYFIFPKRTLILPEKSLILSDRLSGFSDMVGFRLYSSTLEELARME